MMLPDGFISSVMVVESFNDMKALLHGPVGCRRDLSFISSILCPKTPKSDSTAYRKRYYANNHRVPCTEVDGEDYISGAIHRLDEAIDIVAEVDDDYIAIINTPGVSLIGENCEDLIIKKGLEKRVLALDADYISIPVGEGYDRTLSKLLRWLEPVKGETLKGKVNIIGLSLFTRDWKSVLDDLRQILEAMGLEVLCAPGTSCSIEEFRNSVNADFNVVVCSEYCQRLKKIYEEFGVPSVDIHEAPVGFDAMKRWIDGIAAQCGADSKPARKILDKTIRRAYDGMSSSRGAMSLKGKTLAIWGDSTIVTPMVKWLYRYLAIVPISIQIMPGEDPVAMEELKGFLEEIGCQDSLGAPISSGTYVIAGDGDTVRRMELGDVCKVGLDIGYPSLYDSNFMRKNVIGHNGALYVLERIVNGRPLMTMM